MSRGPVGRVAGGFTVAFRSLKTRNYRLFWLGQMTSTVGTWAGEVALAWLVLNLTNSPAMLGLAVTIRFLPSIILSPFTGVLADRVAKRPLILAAQCSQLLLALTLGLLSQQGLIAIAVIFVLEALRGVADAVDMPARQAFVMEMVGSEDLSNAVALNSLQFNVGRILGPTIGAALIGTIGITSCFFVNAASFLVVIGCLLALRSSELHPVATAAKSRMSKQLREVVAFSLRTPDIALILLLVFFISTFGYNFMTILPLLARYVLDSGAAGLGGLTASLGVGSMLAAMWMAYRGKPTRRLLAAAATIFALLLLAMGFSRTQGITMAILVGVGICGILFLTTANTRLQLLSPGTLRGRVMGLYSWILLGMTPLGSLLVGWLAEWTGAQAMVLETAGLCAGGVAAGLIYARRNRGRMVTKLEPVALEGEAAASSVSQAAPSRPADSRPAAPSQADSRWGSPPPAAERAPGRVDEAA